MKHYNFVVTNIFSVMNARSYTRNSSRDEVPEHGMTYIILSVYLLTAALYRVGQKTGLFLESDYPRQSYDVIAIFKMAAVSHVGFGLGQW